MNALTVEQLRNLLELDLKGHARGIKTGCSYSFFNGAGPEFDKLIYAIVRDWTESEGSTMEADQLLALLRPTNSLPSVIQGAIGFLDLLLLSPNEQAPPKDSATIISHGNSCYSIGRNPPKRVDDTEDCVLQPFLRVPALNLPDLAKLSGVPRPSDVLKRLETKYDGIFAPAIHLPDGKSQGGYYVAIRAAASA